MNLDQYLIDVGDRLDREGKEVCANAIDNLLASQSLTKVAQYVGVIGYVLKQNRAMENCIRKKRVSSSDSMQNVILSCLKEYQDGQKYENTEWHSKYAQSIKQNPDNFDSLHVKIANEITDTENIKTHIAQVQSAALILHDHGVDDEVMLQVLKHAEELSGILDKDGAKHPFKLAAPSSPRSNWSKFWTPSQFNWWNPMSWKGRWQRGEDQDVMTEMDSVLENLRYVTQSVQQMKTNIFRVKSQLSGYMLGSTQNLPITEDPSTVNTIKQQIDALDPSNWHQSYLAIDQLRYLLRETPVKNTYNNQHVQLALGLIDNLYTTGNYIYQSMEQIQNLMANLRQRNPVKGRETGLTDEGRPNPFGMSSPANEFGVLDQVLSKVYENPFNEKALYYAEKMHARLDDRLRYIQNAPDDDTTEWLNTQNEMQPSDPVSMPQNPQSPQETQTPAETELQNDVESLAPDESGVQEQFSQEQVDKITQDLIDVIQDPESGNSYDGIARALAILKTHIAPNDPRIQSLIEALTEKSQQNQSPAEQEIDPEVEAELARAFPDPSKQDEFDPDLMNFITEGKPNEYPEPWSQEFNDQGEVQPQEIDLNADIPQQPAKPETNLTTEVKSPVNNPATKSKKRRGRRNPKYLSRAREILSQLPEVGPMASIDDLVKVANVLDKIDPGLSDLIDGYIAEQKNIIINVPKFPSFGKPIREKGKSQNKYQITQKV